MTQCGSEKTAAQLAGELAEARAQVAELKRTLDTVPDPIFSFSPEGHCTYANQALAEALGKPVEGIVGKRIWDLFP
jgi:PAS domain S-box-containing protein